ncbi:MAG: hypothetical protein COB36_14050 [Alphaproteobacteria bacterium]|nr:MAG: hypothetical protein COB36_14050 [Alphaproteobacteria bacterium]
MNKPSTLFQKLSEECDDISLQFSLKDTIVKNIESFYHYGTRRIAFLFYCIEWSAHIEKSKGAVPQAHVNKNSKKLNLNLAFQDLNNPDIAEIKELNLTFSDWTYENVLRGLDEFFQYYLLNAFDLSASLNFSNKEIKISQIYQGILKEKDFERAGLKERLNILEKDFGLSFKYKEEVLSFNNVRNVLSHHDGYVRAGDCNNNYIEIFWLAHAVKARRRDTGKLVPLQRLSYLDTNKYDELKFDFFSKQRRRKFFKHDRIKISEGDLREICQFYLLVLNTFQESLCELALKNNYSVRSFSEYRLSEQISAE